MSDYDLIAIMSAILLSSVYPKIEVDADEEFIRDKVSAAVSLAHVILDDACQTPRPSRLSKAEKG